jgi:thymidylate kinase
VFTVALIGPDGAGKTTVSKNLETELPFPVKSIYMGVNLHSSSTMLPHMRLLLALRRRLNAGDEDAASDIKTFKAPPRTALGRFGAAARSGLRLTNWLAEEWYRQAVASYYTHRGTVVLYDRHFFADFYEEVAPEHRGGRRLSQRIHGLFLRHVYPKPDLVISLDAPAEVLYERKPEGSLDRLRKKQAEYRAVRELLPDVVVVDAAMSTDEVTKEVASVIQAFFERRRSDAVQRRGRRRPWRRSGSSGKGRP